MTANQSAILVANPHTKKAMAVLTKFAKIEAEYKAAEAESKAATELIKEAMIAGGVDKVTIDMPGWEGYITLAERTVYRADNIAEVNDKYIKPSLDTAKVKAEAVLTGQLPAGVTESKTQYITKKLKEV
jgi:hypothetical protein